MKKRWRFGSPASWIGVLGVFVVALILGFVALLSGTPAPPTDTELQARFRKHLPTFSKLRDMIMSEPILRGVGEDYLCGRRPGNEEHRTRSYWRHGREWSTNDREDPRTMPDLEQTLKCVGLSARRYKEYLRLLGIVGGKRVRWSGAGGSWHQVSVWIYGIGNVASSIEKYIVFFPDGIPECYTVVDNTDQMPDETEWFSPLGDGYYIRHFRS